MNPMQLKTPEERRAIRAKAAATTRARIEAERATQAEAKARVLGLKEEIAALERTRDDLVRQQMANATAAALTGKRLLLEEEIVAAAQSWNRTCGVYFLVSAGRVVYVGQSVDVFARLSVHAKTKSFDAMAYVACAPELLDKLESLYIHTLQPEMDGLQRDGAKVAPLSLQEILSA